MVVQTSFITIHWFGLDQALSYSFTVEGMAENEPNTTPGAGASIQPLWDQGGTEVSGAIQPGDPNVDALVGFNFTGTIQSLELASPEDALVTLWVNGSQFDPPSSAVGAGVALPSSATPMADFTMAVDDTGTASVDGTFTDPGEGSIRRYVWTVNGTRVASGPQASFPVMDGDVVGLSAWNTHIQMDSVEQTVEITQPPPGCTSNDDCAGDLVCENGDCVEPPDTGGCSTNADCTGDLVCVNGQCVTQTDGGNRRALLIAAGAGLVGGAFLASGSDGESGK